MGDRQERMRFFLLMHPRISALVILGVAGVIAAYDGGRLADPRGCRLPTVANAGA